MRILLQDAQTGLYLNRGGGWTDNPAGALAFLDEVRAEDFGVYRWLTGARVVVFAETGVLQILEAAPPNPAPTNLSTEPEYIMKITENVMQTKRAARTRANKTKPATKVPAEVPSREKTPRKSSPAMAMPVRRAASTESFTVVEARIDVGLGNTLFIRGQGDGLSWEKGQPLQCVDPSTWVWATCSAREKVFFKLLLNDQVWAAGEDLVLQAGRKVAIAPSF